MSVAVGIDIGGTDIRAAVVEPGGTVLVQARTATDAQGEPAAIVAQIVALFEEVMAALPGLRPVGVGVCAPGPLDADAGIVIAPPTLPRLRDVPLRAILAERFGLPVTLDNDGHAAALGEWRFGAGRGLDHFVYVTVSTGIGGGIVCDGRLLRGRRGLAGHVGHMSIVESGPLCGCGNRGCWEALASGSALGRAGEEAVAGHPGSLIGTLAGEGPVTARHVVAAARQSDAAALDLMRREGHALGVGLTNLLHLYSPERIVIGGGLSAAFDLMEAPIRAAVAARAMPEFRGVPIGTAALGPDAGVIGAAALVLGAAPSAAAA